MVWKCENGECIQDIPIGSLSLSSECSGSEIRSFARAVSLCCCWAAKMVQYILPHWYPSTNCTCESWLFSVNIRLLTWVYSQVIWLQTCLVKKAHSHPIESITYDNVHHHLELTAGNQIKVGALGDNGKCCRLIKHWMIITLFSDELTFLWSHTSKTLATAIHFINTNSVMVMYLNHKM